MLTKVLAKARGWWWWWSRRPTTSDYARVVTHVEESLRYTHAPYHNMRHVASVVTMTEELTQRARREVADRKHLLLLAALLHDVHHPAKSSQDAWDDAKHFEHFVAGRLTRLPSEEQVRVVERILHEKASWNEKMHAIEGLFILHACDVRMAHEPLRTMVETIVYTSLDLHELFLSRFDAADPFWHGALVLKLADLGHFFMSVPVHVYWVFKLHEEQYRIDKRDTHRCVRSVAQNTLAFGARFVEPLLRLVEEHDVIADAETVLLAPYERNRSVWKTFM